MATSVSSFGRIRVKQQRGEPLPEGWLVDREGKPITDSKRADEGLLVPIGGPKGSGLALMIALLAGTLNAAAAGREVVDFNKSSEPTNTGHAFAALKIAAFDDVLAVKRRVDALLRDIAASEPVPGGDGVRVPGARGEALYRERVAGGIPLHPKLVDSLRTLASELKIAAP
jgi:LDH2 family malate/lactate/ureidoglycolate dehydrogenase